MFNCLVNAPFSRLQNASGEATKLVPYGTWAFLPVTDGSLLPQRPSTQLLAGAVNGYYIMTGNNAQEGAPFVPQNISTDADVQSWATTTFPGLNNQTWAALQLAYPDPSQTSIYSSNQLRADLMYAESTFVCPAYWLVQAFPTGNAWKYQFAVPPATHGLDTEYYFPAGGVPPAGKGAFATAFTSAFANFIVNWNPTIPVNPADNPNTTLGTFDGVPWQPYQLNGAGNYQVNFNVTATNATSITAIGDETGLSTGVEERCVVWRSLGSQISE